MKADEFEIVDPRADSTAESLRTSGCTLSNAIADLVDNGMAAESTEIAIQLTWSGSASWIGVKDRHIHSTEDSLHLGVGFQ